MLLIPFCAFWALLFYARKELGLKWSFTFIAIWTALLFGLAESEIPSPSYYFVVGQAVLDIILILVIFGGDIRIR